MAGTKDKKSKAEEKLKKKSKTEEKPKKEKKEKKVEDKPKKEKKEKKVEDKPKKEKKEKKGKKNVKDAAITALQSCIGYDAMMDTIEKKYDTGSSQLAIDNKAKLSSGMLVLDLVLSGGILGGGWYTFFGQEQSAKSTLAMQCIIAALNTETPLIGYYDYEGSSSPDYIENIMKSMGVKGDIQSVFGVRDTEGGWVIKPRVRYYQPGTAEAFFDSLAKLLRTLPDIKMVGDTQYYVYPDEKQFRSIVGNRFDEKKLKKTGMLYVPTERYIKHQAVFVIDSYPAMLPEKQDEDDPGSAMAVQARMFSEQIKRVKSRLKPKRVTLIGVNQLRLRPGVVYGSPEYEPGGEALKLFSDARIRCASRSIPHGKGQLEEEPSVTGEGVDVYRYVNWRAIKNKLGAPNLEGWTRIWVSDNDGKGRGFCPVYDTHEFLKMTGLLSGTRNKLVLKIPQFQNLKKRLTWMQFKTLITGTKEQKAKVYKQIGYNGKPFNLRSNCFKMFENGEAMKLFFDKKTKSVKSQDEDDDED